ncbi:MAG TPA: Trp biosynthesis-associated membrane protein [Streptosporangiaceae bacterium]|nr:Trp biosynthesis-associated membrane protein [Streptosporangiaceae bacterium]
MTAGDSARPSGPQPRRELTLLIAMGAAGAGLVLLATRQGWAHVTTTAPKPLPASVTTANGQALVPAADALALAALAGLAAVLATRRTLRRIAGVVLAALGVGIAAAVSAGISAADVVAAASPAVPGGPAAVSGTSIGSTTSGGTGGSGQTGSAVSGLPSHVVFVAFPWRWVALVGALGVIAAGVLLTWRATRLPVMSSRYEPPTGIAAPEPAIAGSRGASSQGAGRDTASLWESLSRGEDPTGPE